ncbi:MAG: VWA domain-containing protein [Gemmataceae bacterium]
MLSYFTTPALLLALAVVAALGALAFRAHRRRRRTLAALGPVPVARAGGRVRRGVAWALGLSLVAAGAAGPRWGLGPPPPTAPGRDVILVLDLSRSMMAADALPTRLGRAKQALGSFIDAVQAKGGHRLAVIAFAGRAAIVCPLTHDYDAVRARLADLDADLPPPAVRADGGASGTRIGDGLRLAVTLCDPIYRGAQEIVLLSDGDDPAGDDEWRLGLAAARDAGVPVNAVGVGDPNHDSPLPIRYQGTDVMTRLHEEPLRELARRTGGDYVALRTGPPELDGLFRSRVAGKPTREAVAGTLPQPVGRQAWFFAAALTLIAPTMLSIHLRRKSPSMAIGGKSPPPIAIGGLVGLISLSLISAAPPEDYLRHGLAHLDAGRPDAALADFARAAERTIDPGLVAFNQGIALARLGRHRDAELHFRRCLSDAEGDRRARALYNLGVMLLQESQGKLAGPLRHAVAAFTQALPLADESLRPDVLHNLELAKVLLAKAKPSGPQAADEPPDFGPERKPPTGPEPADMGDPAFAKGEGKAKAAGKANGKQSPQSTDGKPPPGKGNLPPLPDSDTLAELTPEDVARHLDQAEQRIAEARRTRLRTGMPSRTPSYPEW